MSPWQLAFAPTLDGDLDLDTEAEIERALLEMADRLGENVEVAPTLRWCYAGALCIGYRFDAAQRQILVHFVATAVPAIREIADVGGRPSAHQPAPDAAP